MTSAIVNAQRKRLCSCPAKRSYSYYSYVLAVHCDKSCMKPQKSWNNLKGIYRSEPRGAVDPESEWKTFRWWSRARNL